MTRVIDETGKQYGHLTVVKRAPNRKGGKARWLCQCDCGNTSTVDGNNLRSGMTKSCGCQRGIHLPSGVAAFNQVYNMYRINSRYRKRDFKLTKTELKNLTQQSCHYCGHAPRSLKKEERYNGWYAYNGLDRVDNTRGYIIDNVVPCCFFCNRAKREASLNEFRDWAIQLHQHLTETEW